MSIIDHANLGRVDLNLMVAFDAIMSERNVTRAARRVGVTQSAMSHNLGRLRTLFADELFTRSSRGVDPTPRAFEVAEFVRPVLSSIQTGFSEKAPFDPSTAERVFTFGMSDYLEQLLLPEIVGAMRVAAPKVSVEVRAMDDATAAETLDGGTIDVAISKISNGGAAHKRRTLWTDHYVVIHPERGTGALDLRAFLECQHVMVTARDGNCRTVDLRLAELGHRRSVVVTTPHLAAIPSLVLRGGLMAVIPAGFTSEFGAIAGLRISPLPFEVAGFDFAMSWHSSFDRDPAHIWLRSKVVEARDTIVQLRNVAPALRLRSATI